MYATIYESGLISFDMTLLFQIMNVLLLVLIIVGIPILIIRFIKTNKIKNDTLMEINKKLDVLIIDSKNRE